MSGPVYDYPSYGKGPIDRLKEAKTITIPSPLAESLDEIAGGIVEMLLKKNTDYGDSYRRLRDEFGPDSFLIRIGDKYHRLMALRGKEALVSETTDDTIRDIVGYCFLEMVYRRGEAE